MNDYELVALTKMYGNAENDIEYLRFLDDANPFKGMFGPVDPNATKITYIPA